jgi:hypothetical protein
LLDAAARRFAAVRGPIRSDYDSGSEIMQFVVECTHGIEHGTLDLDAEEELWRIFAPAGDWDNVVGDIELGNEIFVQLDRVFGAGNEVKGSAT